MQRAQLTSSGVLAAAKKEINDALIQLDASSSNAQSVYTGLTAIYNTVADHPQSQLAVDSTLATQKSVRLLRELVQMHLREEEVQWALGRVISLAGQASLRFQCQAGQVEMWNELFDMRSAQPESIRVQEASLRASEALFRCNEFNVSKLQPQLLFDDLFGVMDRFLRVQTPRRRAHGIVVLALRVLAALFSSPRPTGLLLFNGESPSKGEKWTCEISRRMLDSFSIFNKDIDSIRSWLDMALLLLRQYPVQAMENLFSTMPIKEVTWWFLSVVERWQTQAEVMNSLLATLTHIFALPHHTPGDERQVVLAEKLMREQSLLDVVCKVIEHYHEATRQDATTSHQRGSLELVLLEAIRVVRQWSERPTLALHIEDSCSVGTVLLPVLIEQMDLQVKQSSTSSMSSKQLIFVLEILLVFRHLAASRGLRRVLASSDKLQTSLKWLRCCTRSASCNSVAATGRSSRSDSATGVAARDDDDLDALVAREARNVVCLLASGLDGAPKSAAVSRGRGAGAIVVARAVAPPRRQKLMAEHVKPETLLVYSNGRRPL